MKRKLLITLLALCLGLIPVMTPLPQNTQNASALTIVHTYDLSKGVTLKSHETVCLSWVYMKKGDQFKTSLTTSDTATVGVCSLKSGSSYGIKAKNSHSDFYTISQDGYYRIFIYNNCSKKITCKGVVWHVR